jgi:predicted dehydrogenase
MRCVVRGGGSIGSRHVRVLRDLGQTVDVWPVRDRRAGTSGSAGHEPGRVRVLDGKTGPDALRRANLVVVATDTSRHVADAIEALDAGTGIVLVEKPVAPREADGRRLAEHPRADRVWVAAPLRAHQAFRRLHALVNGDVLPTSAHVWSQSWLPDWRPERDFRQSYSARADQGGVLRDLIHEIDYVNVLLGPATLTGAQLDHDGPLPIDAEQAATLLWRTAGTTVTCRLDYTTRPATRGLVLRGAAGALVWDLMAGTVTWTGADGRSDAWQFPADLDRDQVMATQAAAALRLDPTDDLQVRLEAGAPASLGEALAAVRLCDQARRWSLRSSNPGVTGAVEHV